MSHYDKNLEKNKANYVPLTPISFLKGQKIFILIIKQFSIKANLYLEAGL